MFPGRDAAHKCCFAGPGPRRTRALGLLRVSGKPGGTIPYDRIPFRRAGLQTENGPEVRRSMQQAAKQISPPGRGWRTPLAIIAFGCIIALVGNGVRTTFGLFLEPMSFTHGWGREVFAFAIAVQNLVWGAGQPFAGMLADRYGTVPVMVLGLVCYGIGIALMAFSSTPAALVLTGGILVGLGLAGGSFMLVLSAFGRLVPEEKRSSALGIATAAGSFGQFAFAPAGQAFIAAYGWQTALLLLAACLGFMLPMTGALKGRPERPAGAGSRDQTMTEALREAFGHDSYVLLVFGFFVCGFHVAFITAHMPAYLQDLGVGGQTLSLLGFTSNLAAWAIALVGLFNIIGSYAAGVAGGRYSKRYLLSGIYFARAAVIAWFVLTPQTLTTVLIFSALMGILWLSTVPLTSGLVAVMFGTRYMATLFGIVFFSHQAGSFIGVWLGGYLFDRSGSYDAVWWLGIALGIFAGIVHLPIREQPVPRSAAT